MGSIGFARPCGEMTQVRAEAAGGQGEVAQGPLPGELTLPGSYTPWAQQEMAPGLGRGGPWVQRPRPPLD